MTQGFALVQMDRNIIFVYLVMHENNSCTRVTLWL